MNGSARNWRNKDCIHVYAARQGMMALFSLSWDRKTASIHVTFENQITKSCGGSDNIVSIIFCLPETPVVGLEDTSYTVYEDTGQVDVCALIIGFESCPLQFAFNVTLSTRDETAGT